MKNKLLFISITTFIISTITMFIDFLPVWSAIIWCASAAYMLGKFINYIILRKQNKI